MSLFEKIKNKKEKIAVVGLGYVGLPIAVAFAKKGLNVIGFDINKEKINNYKLGIDSTKEIGNKNLKKVNIEFTTDVAKIREAKFIIIAVPTPINLDNKPDLTMLKEASKVVGQNLVKESIIVYESTVYPGCTEEICIPILEKESKLKCGKDFKVGYSPERINPGDTINKLENIKKIVSAVDEESLNDIKNIYDLIIDAKSYPVSNIKTAEAVKVIENTQRYINIAFMNEMSIILNNMEIETNEVIGAMETKWNSLNFKPGLVGGHCIGVDPYYLLYKAEELGFTSQMISSSSIVNNNMGKYIADVSVKKMKEANQNIQDSKVLIMGVTFKENCPDIRNTKVYDIIKRLREYQINPVVYDPLADKSLVKREYGIELLKEYNLENIDCIIITVAHDVFKNYLTNDITKEKSKKVIIDVKGILDEEKLKTYNINYWRL